jgi:hypothetical protein
MFYRPTRQKTALGLQLVPSIIENIAPKLSPPPPPPTSTESLDPHLNLLSFHYKDTIFFILEFQLGHMCL